MDAMEFWHRYAKGYGPPSELQEQAIDMFLEGHEEILWQSDRQTGRSTVRKAIIRFLEEEEKLEQRGGPPSYRKERFQVWDEPDDFYFRSHNGDHVRRMIDEMYGERIKTVNIPLDIGDKHTVTFRITPPDEQEKP